MCTRFQINIENIMILNNFQNYDIELKKIFENEYNVATRYELLNAVTLTWNNLFHIRLYAIC